MGQIMLGFVVRQCAIALDRAPSPADLMEWANHQGTRSRPYCLFGRAITIDEARVILRHPGRPVTVREEGPHPLFALGVLKDSDGQIHDLSEPAAASTQEAPGPRALRPLGSERD